MPDKVEQLKAALDVSIEKAKAKGKTIKDEVSGVLHKGEAKMPFEADLSNTCKFGQCINSMMPDSQFCNTHRCTKTTKSGGRCKSSVNCKVPHLNKEEAVKATTSSTPEHVTLTAISLFVIVGIQSYDGVKNFFFSGTKQTLRVETFAQARQQVLDNSDNENVKCYIFQVGGQTFAMKRNGEWKTLEDDGFILKQDKFNR